MFSTSNKGIFFKLTQRKKTRQIRVDSMMLFFHVSHIHFEKAFYTPQSLEVFKNLNDGNADSLTAKWLTNKTIFISVDSK